LADLVLIFYEVLHTVGIAVGSPSSVEGAQRGEDREVHAESKERCIGHMGQDLTEIVVVLSCLSRAVFVTVRLEEEAE
jgi:branched-subunit amino acid permease